MNALIWKQGLRERVVLCRCQRVRLRVSLEQLNTGSGQRRQQRRAVQSPGLMVRQSLQLVQYYSSNMHARQQLFRAR